MPSQEHTQSLSSLKHKGYTASVSKDPKTDLYRIEMKQPQWSDEDADLGTLTMRFEKYIDDLTANLGDPPSDN